MLRRLCRNLFIIINTIVFNSGLQPAKVQDTTVVEQFLNMTGNFTFAMDNDQFLHYFIINNLLQ